MTVPIPVLVVAALIASTWTRINAVILGRPVSVPPLLLIAVLLVLVLVVAALWLLRAIAREGLRSSPYPRTVT